MYTRHLFLFAVGLLCVSARAEDCALTDRQAQNLALKYVRENLRRTSPETAEERLRVSITARSNNARTVVVSPLPVTPDASFMLRVTCELKVEEVEAP
jgi:hypothetical protein